MSHISEHHKDDYLISTDKSKLQIDVIHNFLKNAYWSKNKPRDLIEKSIAGSLCYGIYHKNRQVGFGRVITDYATFGYLADIFIIEEYRGKGLSKWLMECILSNPELQSLRGWLLRTSDAHGLYEKFGFKVVAEPEKLMELRLKSVY